MNNPTITVIVPIYNVEKYVSKCLESLINQTYKNFVVFAISDGSPDNSEEIVKKFASKDNRIKFFYKKNGGYGSVLEYAIKRVTTKYFLVCDPDDWLENTALEELYNFSEKNNIDVLVGDKYKIYTQDKRKEYIKSFKEKDDIKPLRIYSDDKSIQKFAFGEGSPHAKLYKTSVAKDIKFPHNVRYTDTILYVISLMKAKRVAYYNHALSYYLIDRPGNSMTDKSEAKIRDQIIVVKNIFSQVLECENKTSIIMYYLYYWIEILLGMMTQYSFNSFKHTYRKEIDNLISSLTFAKYKIKTVVYKQNSIKEKIIYKGLMGRYMRNIFINTYFFYKKLSHRG